MRLNFFTKDFVVSFSWQMIIASLASAVKESFLVGIFGDAFVDDFNAPPNGPDPADEVHPGGHLKQADEYLSLTPSRRVADTTCEHSA